MTKEEVFNVFYGKEKREIWEKFQNIEKNIENSNELYIYFNEISKMLTNEESYIKMRGFRIICKLSKWDKESKVNLIINDLLNVLDDDKPTIIRKCLETINDLFLYKPELYNIIKNKLKNINLSNYKDTMAPLIKKDIYNVLNCYDK